jgi:uncharacterized SAM-binding protein YcdF (DUF218 family)
LAVVFHTAILGAIGGYLVKTDPAVKADLALVLAGDAYGDRIKYAGELVRKGYAPYVLVSGPSGNYGYHECDLAIPFAVKAGYPESYFVHAEHDGRSTTEEAQDMIPYLKARHASTVLLVTSDFHTRRAGRTFRSVIPGVNFIVEGAPGSEFSPGGWWHNRQGRKICFGEWTRTVAQWFGI